MDIHHLLNRRKVNIERLLAFGFSEDENGYAYATDLFDGQFIMKVTLTKEGEIATTIMDVLSGELYILHRVPSTTGAFVTRVRNEHLHVLTMIAETCFESDVFKSKDAKQVIRYVGEKYQNDLEFLWKRFPDNAIFRRQDSAKWYAVLLIVQKKKLGLVGDEAIEILGLRMPPEKVTMLVDGKRYFVGYHMNKKHWVSICLNGSVALEEIFCLIDESFVLAAKQ